MTNTKQVTPYMKLDTLPGLVGEQYVWISYDGQAETCRKCCRVIRWTKTEEGYRSGCCGSVEFMAQPRETK